MDERTLPTLTTVVARTSIAAVIWVGTMVLGAVEALGVFDAPMWARGLTGGAMGGAFVYAFCGLPWQVKRATKADMMKERLQEVIVQFKNLRVESSAGSTQTDAPAPDVANPTATTPLLPRDMVRHDPALMV